MYVFIITVITFSFLSLLRKVSMISRSTCVLGSNLATDITVLCEGLRDLEFNVFLSSGNETFYSHTPLEQ